ncbi:MAG: hypothetical protein V7L04_04755 [Nostoc sp.]|uniref:hypothetical protein n=1 Tax=Nostoc sp. TaxID=1180 RepID=UPI002FF7BDB8
MSVQIMKSKCGLVLTCLLGQIILFAAPVQAGVSGKSYTVNVNSSLGDYFTACFQFNTNGNLHFSGQSATYNVNQTSWQAVTNPPSSVATISLKGVTTQGDYVINGTGMNSKNTTFTFNGTLLSQPTCPAELPLTPGNLQFGGNRENPFLQ